MQRLKFHKAGAVGLYKCEGFLCVERFCVCKIVFQGFVSVQRGLPLQRAVYTRGPLEMFSRALCDVWPILWLKCVMRGVVVFVAVAVAVVAVVVVMTPMNCEAGLPAYLCHSEFRLSEIALTARRS
eukprot:2579535-Amphidinium_carterae.3